MEPKNNIDQYLPCSQIKTTILNSTTLIKKVRSPKIVHCEWFRSKLAKHRKNSELLKQFRYASQNNAFVLQAH